MKYRKYLIAAGVILAIGMSGYWYMMFTGPHMVVQQHIRAYQEIMPLPPRGMVAVAPDQYAVPAAAEAARLRNPLQDTQANRDRGKVYYGYYCVFCHGENGQGDGPVGYSYMPAPTDLHDPKVLDMTDGGLMRGMLKGVGHDPVLEKTVLPGHRWYLVTYVRALGKTPRRAVENPGMLVVEPH